MPSFVRTFRSFFFLAVVGWAGLSTRVHALDSTPVTLSNSFNPVQPDAISTRTRPYISRSSLTAQETAAPIDFELSLKMHDFDELQQRVQRGDRISPSEMAGRYEPTAAEYQKLVAWAQKQNLTIVRQDDHHMVLFLRGSVAHVATVFRSTFARVTYRGREYTSAISAPSIPQELSGTVLGVNGLQPHLHPHKNLIQKQGARTNASGGGNGYIPSQIAAAYNATALYNAKLDGSGETIAIVIDTFPSTSDLVHFWKSTGVAQSISNMQFIQVVPGQLADPSGEETLDTEWASSMAPGAKVRVYASYDLYDNDLDETFQQVISDVSSHPEYHIHEMSMSFGEGENDTTQSEFDTRKQFFAELAAAGVTIFVSSGDGGSTPSDDVNHPENGPLQADTPASDPSVTSVGGTSLQLSSNNSVTSETVWNSDGGAGGGGTSVFAARPSWQIGKGVNTSAKRQVPDISATADPEFGGLVYLDGADTVFGGTSLATPICAGLCALANEALANSGQSTIGLLGPHIYPLLGTSNFRDITSGNNATANSGGKYSAAVGYDEASGLGVPLMQVLTQTLVGSSTLNGVKGPASMVEIQPGATATFTVSAAGNSPSYKWQREPLGASSFSTLADSGTYSGSSSATLTVASATLDLSGDQFRCLVTFGSSTGTTTASTLVVESPLVVSTLAGSPTNTGATNGTGTGARFDYPSGVALDSSGNIYVADDVNNQIRKVTPAGVVTTPFGNLSGSHGGTNGSGNNATFYNPNAVCIDSSNTIYVADSGNNSIRKISGTTVTTLVGASTGLSVPNGVAVDGSGNVYIADTGNDVIRKVTPGGSVSTLAGRSGVAGSIDGAATSAEFDAPEAVAVNSAGTEVYVADFANSTVRMISGGQVTTVAGVAGQAGYLDGLATSARFNSPTGLALDSAGNLYITDALVPSPNSTGAGNNVLRKLSTTGVVSTLAGNPDVDGSADGTGASASFYSLQAVALDPTGVCYLADAYNQTIRVARPSSSSTGTGGSGGPTIALSNLTTTYDGSAHAATVTTSPGGLSYSITYAGSVTPPTDAGSYAVVATVTATGYSGTATGTLVISPAAATIVFNSSQTTYNGSPQVPVVNTSPGGLPTQILFNDTSTEPTNAGGYIAVATVTDTNYVAATIHETFTINKATASVDVDGQSAMFTGSGQAVTSTTSPAGLSVSCTYNGGGSLPVAPGSYAVAGTVKDANYTGSGTGTFTIIKATPTLAFAGAGAGGSGNIPTLTVAYNGKPHPVVATTTPTGLPVSYIYTVGGTSSSSAPSLVGTYQVVATVNNADYTGSLTGTLIISAIPPLTTTGSAKPLAENAMVTGTVNPEGSSTTTRFEYGPTASYGLSMAGPSLAAGAANATATATLTGLAPKTLYHYRIDATSNGGTTSGADKTFTTLAAPTLGTVPQTLLGASGAEIGLAVTPNGYATTVYFEYGTTTAYGSTTAVQNIGSGKTPVNVYALFPQLAPNSTYYYRMVVSNATGTQTEDFSFTTLAYDTTVVASTGSVAPSNASGTTTFASFGNAILNSADGVAFKAAMAGGGITSANATGIWADVGGALELVAQVGTPAPGTGGDAFATLSDPVYNDSDASAFIGTLKTGTGGVTSLNASGIWAEAGSSPQLVVRQGGAASGAGSATFSAFTSCALTESGDVIFGATLATNTAAGVTAANNLGIWEGTFSGPALALRTGQTFDGETLAQFSFMPLQLVVNSQTREFSPVGGNLVCNATFSDKKTGIVDVIAGTPHVVVISGASADGLAGTIYATFGHPAINDSAHTAFTGTLSLNVGGVAAATSKGVWADDSGGTRRLIARSGSGNAPSAPAPFASFSDPVYNSSSEVAFEAMLTSGSGVWCTTGGTLTNIALTSTSTLTAAPGCPLGANFASFTELALNDNGGVAFLATLTPSAVGGVTSANDVGVWAVDNTGALRLIVRTGDTLSGKTVTAISFLPAGTLVYGQTRSVDRTSGDLIYGVTFSDKTSAICNVVFP